MLDAKVKEQLSQILNDMKFADQLLKNGKIIDCHNKFQSIRTRLVNVLINDEEEKVAPNQT